MRESDLYQPIKTLLMARGFEVKGEVGAADLVARRGDEPPLIVELKLRLTLALYHQAIARLAMTDHVYIGVPRPIGKTARRALRDNLSMCRRLGIGLITVHKTTAEIRCDPGPFNPRKSPKKETRLLRAFDRLTGDPNDGGATRHGLVTGYRQDALRCAAHLADNSPAKGRDVAAATGVKQATTIMRDNHYGWFARVEKGTYALTRAGADGLAHWAYSWED